ncbi:glutathione S-transferase C-terminal domain-containing protein [Endobacter medicaginis]|uniref:glutathione S-transferase C-terminal domain-containing protein n=1 Tax=Endobacter medicaginis TaxID=1181271 RepID=UPI001C3FF809|nr:glutathione S-transferase C-terminal domain-containing protein [Endobacter medicaginis]MCX5477003.1 glutathione S-transferase family protein [Endobacter medicaginis]
MLCLADSCTIADISAWSWLDRADRVFKGTADPLAPFPNLRRLMAAIDAHPSAG